MAVLVDPLREYPDTGLPFRRWSHLVSDESFEELHAFAAGSGSRGGSSRATTTTCPRTCAPVRSSWARRPVTTRELLARMAGPRGERARRVRGDG